MDGWLNDEEFGGVCERTKCDLMMIRFQLALNDDFDANRDHCRGLDHHGAIATTPRTWTTIDDHRNGWNHDHVTNLDGRDRRSRLDDSRDFDFVRVETMISNRRQFFDATIALDWVADHATIHDDVTRLDDGGGDGLDRPFAHRHHAQLAAQYCATCPAVSR